MCRREKLTKFRNTSSFHPSTELHHLHTPAMALTDTEDSREPAPIYYARLRKDANSISFLIQCLFGLQDHKLLPAKLSILDDECFVPNHSEYAKNKLPASWVYGVQRFLQKPNIINQGFTAHYWGLSLNSALSLSSASSCFILRALPSVVIHNPSISAFLHPSPNL